MPIFKVVNLEGTFAVFQALAILRTGYFSLLFGRLAKEQAAREEKETSKRQESAGARSKSGSRPGSRASGGVSGSGRSSPMMPKVGIAV